MNASKLLLDKLRCEQSLHEFVLQAWSQIEGKNPFIDGWYIWVLCEHLEQAYRGKIPKLIFNVPPRTGKPVSKDTLLLTLSGERKRIEDIQVGDYVLTHAGRFRKVLAKYEQGALETLKIETIGGREIISALDHPFLTANGWKNAENLLIGDVLGIPVIGEDFGNQLIPEESRLLGYFVGDGCAVANQFNITCGDEQRIEDLYKCARVLGFNIKIFKYKRKEHHKMLTKISFSKGENSPREWLRIHGLFNKTSYTKKIPDAIIKGNFETISNFLGAYWSCDGEIAGKGFNRKNESRKDIIIGMSSVNEKMLKDTQHLLARLGINSLVRRHIRKNFKTKRQGNEYISYRLVLRNQNDVSNFLHKIKVYGDKINRLTSVTIYRTAFDSKIMSDPIVSISKNGVENCYCLEVEEDHTFTANDIIVHNTSIISVMGPAWAFTLDPSYKFLFASYAQKISLEHSRLCKMLIESDWYQRRWGNRVKLAKDQATKGHFATTAFGHRIATSVNSGGTALGANFLTLDDPNDAKDGESKVTRESTNDWVSRVWSSRLNPGAIQSQILVQQRINEMDVSGYIMSRDEDKEWVRLILPMEFESLRRCKTIPLPSTKGKVWEDPRTKEGELLCPNYLDKKAIRKLKIGLGRYNYAGQCQQRPAPEEGGIIQRKDFRVWTNPKLPKLIFMLQSWDTALTATETSAYSACTTWGVFCNERGINQLLLLHAWRGHVTYPELLKRAIRLQKNCADIYDTELPGNKKNVPDEILVEAKASGFSIISDFLAKGIAAKGFSPDKYGDKVQRVHLATPWIESGKVWVVGDENNKLVKDHEMMVENASLFPNAESRDLVDTMTQAILRLAKEKGMLTHELDVDYSRDDVPKQFEPGYKETKKGNRAENHI